ncbi:MAG: type III-B CRISPR-associated protein Cas10/Cmr2, partial [Candidatus Electrothrix sp. AR3]|nr:type III-B CRISPR-associated protein Cas10/Cmr2 [Candidatus Electrothrix sp. AR3]
MSTQETWLISLAIGPVQDFIAAALRTRDLWFGSHMLSEVSKAAARALIEHKAVLIFPAVEDRTKLNSGSPLNVANRIVAQVQGDKKTVEAIVEAGKEAAKQELALFIKQAWKQTDKLTELREDIWEHQAQPNDLLELYGTAARITEQGPQAYKEARKRLDQLTSARKNSRNFNQSAAKPNKEPFYGLPKSSLDGRRETVLQKVTDKEKDKQVRRKLRMGDGEQLDILG